MIYLDNAATTIRKPQQVIDAVTAAMQSMGNASRGVHDGALQATRTVYHARQKLARFFHCENPSNVVFCSNSTEALNTAINGTIAPRAHVITTELEHNSVLRPLYRLEREQQVTLSFVKADKKGCIDYEDFDKLIQSDTSAIVCTHGSNLTGTILDLERIGRIANRNNLLFIVDASQTAGVIPIDMEKMQIDILCFTGHKSLMGPQGTGGMCVAKNVTVRPLKTGGTGVQSYSRFQPEEMPVRLEAGTLNSHGIAGLSAAIDYINTVGIDVIRDKEEQLMKRFYQGVFGLQNVQVYGDFSASVRAAIIALNIESIDSNEVADELMNTYGIATRPGAHCAPLAHRALGTTERGAVRFSFSWYNTEEEIDAAVDAIRKISEEVRCS